MFQYTSGNTHLPKLKCLRPGHPWSLSPLVKSLMCQGERFKFRYLRCPTEQRWELQRVAKRDVRRLYPGSHRSYLGGIYLSWDHSKKKSCLGLMEKHMPRMNPEMSNECCASSTWCTRAGQVSRNDLGPPGFPDVCNAVGVKSGFWEKKICLSLKPTTKEGVPSCLLLANTYLWSDFTHFSHWKCCWSHSGRSQLASWVKKIGKSTWRWLV